MYLVNVTKHFIPDTLLSSTVIVDTIDTCLNKFRNELVFSLFLLKGRGFITEVPGTYHELYEYNYFGN